MPAYAYKAVHASGRIARGEIDVANENELAHYLGESGLELIDAREKKTRAFALPTSRKAPPRVLSAFCMRMHDLLGSGITFADALRDVMETTDNKMMRNGLMQIARAIANGSNIGTSFALYPDMFPPVFTAIIAAGERTGDMGEIFGYLARYAELSAHTQERLRRALRYPLFLFFVAGSAVAFMLVTVVPQMVQFLNGIQSHLPLSTVLLVGLSSAFANYDGWIGLFVVSAVAGVFAGRVFSPAFVLAIDDVVLRLPFIGTVITKTSLARFTHSFAILFRSGCKTPDCLRQARDTVSNRSLRVGIESAEQRVLSGSSLSLALDNVFPAFAIGLLRIGERSGNLGKCLDDIATAYDREAQAATDSFIGMLEPSLTLAIGALLAWTVLAIMGPLYGSLSVLGGRM